MNIENNKLILEYFTCTYCFDIDKILKVTKPSISIYNQIISFKVLYNNNNNNEIFEIIINTDHYNLSDEELLNIMIDDYNNILSIISKYNETIISNSIKYRKTE